ncbi:MAG: carboxynorspermidine decarboxylase [Alloprevotella sp.]|nr:carboxynorspermidine decarboxylase [Alloprevotella sp.]
MCPTPYYVLYEEKLRNNLALIRRIADEAGVEFILAFKAFALWKTFPVFREYISHTTASSPYEARLALEEFGSRAHTYSPAYEEATFGEILRCSSHVTFNSLSQFERFVPAVRASGEGVSLGLRINPEHSRIETALYDPCAPGSRFGVLASQLPDVLPREIEGFHCHCHCESDSYALEETLGWIERLFGAWLPQLKWLNLGGGHLVTRRDYDVPHLVRILRAFRARHPHLHVILEPGSAFAWQTGDLVASVVDIVENKGIKTAILNVSFTCHMPDCLEMPYWPEVEGAEYVGEESPAQEADASTYRLGGNSCLSGDWLGRWRFPEPLSVGQEIVLKDMIHYTTVKTTMFNGIHHPAIVMQRPDGTHSVLREFTYEDYRGRMD